MFLVNLDLYRVLEQIFSLVTETTSLDHCDNLHKFKTASGHILEVIVGIPYRMCILIGVTQEFEIETLLDSHWMFHLTCVYSEKQSQSFLVVIIIK